MRRRMAVNATAASEEELQDAKGRVREMQSRLSLAQTEREERQSLLEAERVFHQQEIKHLQAQIARAKQDAQKHSNGGYRQEDNLAKSLQILSEKSKTEEALALREDDDIALVKACGQLQKPASALLELFGL